MVVKSKTEMPVAAIDPSGKVLLSREDNARNMAEKAGPGIHVKKGTPECGKHDELVLRPQPARRLTVKGKIANVRPVKPKLRLD